MESVGLSRFHCEDIVVVILNFVSEDLQIKELTEKKKTLVS